MSFDLVPSLSASEAARLLWAFAKAGFYTPKLFDLFLDHSKQLQRRGPLTAQDASNLLWTQAQMALWYPDLVASAVDTLVEGHSSLQVVDLVTAVHSVSTSVLALDVPLSETLFKVRGMLLQRWATLLGIGCSKECMHDPLVSRYCKRFNALTAPLPAIR
jgi:hypothetical protein